MNAKDEHSGSEPPSQQAAVPTDDEDSATTRRDELEAAGDDDGPTELHAGVTTPDADKDQHVAAKSTPAPPIDLDRLTDWFRALAPEAKEVWLAKIANEGVRTGTKMQLEGVAERDQRVFDQEMEKRRMDATWTSRQYELTLDADRRLYKLAFIEAIMRALLAAMLVFGTVGAVFYGIWSGVDSDALSQYLAPVTGLAGLAVGYFFARATAGGQPPARSNQPPPPPPLQGQEPP